ncbi:nuclear receptor coactivator 4 isoform X2 [Hippoglossus stenolepis]|uniref:nuclear receptor coactivator 4 isoform X2 n=1 Tax=Hippoglossus stenolepis TaxID=195615 RepID=UPI00159BF682|nr:nuclear receptor coactivator 4 isoform X2 [Hippoglossus stenolepis]
MTSRESRGARMSSAEAAAGGLKQCWQAQGQLEDAINSVLKAEQQLRENVREVRAELQSCVSRQQEALRCREVWLLDQIELLEQVKTETLQQQLHQLHQLRGQFDIITHQLQNNDLSNQLTSCIEKLSSLSLTPEETPDVSFHADTRSLRNAITSFGSITAQLVEGVSSQSPAPQRVQVQNYPITAKKQMLELLIVGAAGIIFRVSTFPTSEVGALGDWLLGSRPTSNSPIGSLSSKNPQDWLMSLKENKTSCPTLSSVDFLEAWGQLRDLEAWLLQDQAPVSRGRAISSCSSSFSIEKIDESEFTINPDEEELSDWLITPPTDAMETMSNAEQWRQVLKPFNDGWSSSDWLAGSSRPAADCSSCCQTTRAVEIENLGQLKCLKTPPPSSPASTHTPVTPPAAVLEAWLQQAVPVQQTCRANEVCSAYSDCVCEENCGREALTMWLLQQDGRDKNGVPVAKDAPPTTKNPPSAVKNTPPALYNREQKVHAILDAWLHPSSPCSRLLPLTAPLSDWLVPDEEKATREEDSSVFKPASPSPSRSLPWSGGRHDDKWLLKKSQAQERLLSPVCDLFSCMNVGGDKDKWLQESPVQM